MEPPDEYHEWCNHIGLGPEKSKGMGMNEHYSKEDAYERMLREHREKPKEQNFDVDAYMNRRGYKQMYGRKEMATQAANAQYEAMWPLAHAICESLMHEPQKWEFHENRFKHKERGVEFWCHRMSSPVTETFGMGASATEKIFNRAQGEAILEAVKIACVARPNPHQLKVLSMFDMLETLPIVDERKVIHLPQMNFWQRLLFLVTARCKIS